MKYINWKIVAIFICLVILILVNSVSSLVIEKIQTRQLANVYKNEYSAISPKLVSMGLPGSAKVILQCNPTATYFWKSEKQCVNFAHYTYNNQFKFPPEMQYDKTKSDLAVTLKKQGWSSDRNNSTLNDINPYTNINGQASYHKNIGSIGCNLEIALNGSAENGWRLDVNEFICRQNIVYPHLNFRTHRYIGA